MASIWPAHEKTSSLPLKVCLFRTSSSDVCASLAGQQAVLVVPVYGRDGTTTRGQKEEPRLAGGLVAQCSSVRQRSGAMRCDCDAQDSARRVRIWQQEVGKGCAQREETSSPPSTLSSRVVVVPRVVD